MTSGNWGSLALLFVLGGMIAWCWKQGYVITAATIRIERKANPKTYWSVMAGYVLLWAWMAERLGERVLSST
ncbi:hypothetical protein [Phenylobacterium aquaticum]|uniref:hypothetical protein n=1 Tax=Phenylobacterium aquaticum TaxID=1763816 RepID=UPI0026EE1EC2|nr:hypothetical protein [Phenylobacterium aquaticum]